MAKPTAKQIEACRKMGMSDREIAEMYADDDDVLSIHWFWSTMG